MIRLDEKELNIPVKYDDLISHIYKHGEAFVYLKQADKFETVILKVNEYWSGDLTKKYIAEGRLFRRRNKPFKSMMV